MGSVVSHEFGPRNNLPPYVCVPSHADELRRQRLPAVAFAPFSLGSDPADGGFKVQDLNLPGGVDDERFATPQEHARRRSTTTSPRKEKADDLDGDGHVLPAGLQPDQLARRRARRSTSTPSRPSSATSTAATRPASGCCMARRLVEAGVRFVSLTYGGWDMHDGITGGIRGPDAAVRPGVRRADHATSTQRGLLDSDAGHGLERVRPHAEDQRHRRPRPLAEGVQRRAGRRRHQEGLRLRHVGRDRDASRRTTR